MATVKSESPLEAIFQFIREESILELEESYNKMRIVGYVMELGFDRAKIVTCDAFKQAVGGIPRGSFLVMTPDSYEGMPPHFTLLRVLDVADTPLTKQAQEAFFSLQKRAVTSVDPWTASNLQWGAFEVAVLGTVYPSPEGKVCFSGDTNNVFSGMRYKVFSPNEALLNLIVNGPLLNLKKSEIVSIGNLRATECELPFLGYDQPVVPVDIKVADFLGCRTALFGKTRLGKSNVVKLLAQALMEKAPNAGQLIFDINGEYANDNKQNLALASTNPGKCEVFALVPRTKTPSKPLKLNFYEQPSQCLDILKSLLAKDGKTQQYITALTSVELSNPIDISSLAYNVQVRAIRKVQLFWAILRKAGYSCDVDRLEKLPLRAGGKSGPHEFSPKFSADLRNAVYTYLDKPMPTEPTTIDQLKAEMEAVSRFVQAKENLDSPVLTTASGNPLFDSADMALLTFLAPTFGGGPKSIAEYAVYHDASAANVLDEIMAGLNAGKTVILDLGSAEDKIREYFSTIVSTRVFLEQEKKFTSDSLGDSYIQLYFEEAHNLFPPNNTSDAPTDVYSRFAKEGAKFNIGMVYSTQSPSTISSELLSQTENFFVGHLSSQEEVKALSKAQVQYSDLEQDIMSSRTPGFLRMLTLSNRFVVPIQAKLFQGKASAK